MTSGNIGRYNPVVQNLRPYQMDKVGYNAKYSVNRLSNHNSQDNISFKGVGNLTKKGFLNSLRIAANNPSLYVAIVVLVVATTLRPATILAVPGAQKEDKQYAAAKAIATGLISFLLSSIFYIPMERSMKRLATLADKGSNIFFKSGSKELQSFTQIVNQGSQFIIGPFQAFLLLKTIPVVMKNVFSKNKKSKNSVSFLSIKPNKQQLQVFSKFMNTRRAV